MCLVAKFKCDGGPALRNTATQGSEHEWKGDQIKTGSDPAEDEDLHLWRSVHFCCRVQMSPGVQGALFVDFSGF